MITQALQPLVVVNIVLGTYFLFGQVSEWIHLIQDKGLTIQTNLSAQPSTRWSVCTPRTLLLDCSHCRVVMAFCRRRFSQKDMPTCAVLALYWHFVDVVWIVGSVTRRLRHRTLTEKIHMNSNGQETAGDGFMFLPHAGRCSAFGLTLYFAGCSRTSWSHSFGASLSAWGWSDGSPVLPHRSTK